MEDLIREGKFGLDVTPNIKFLSSGILEISGESYLEQTSVFYEPVINWLTKFVNISDKDIVFNVKLRYFNTSSSRYILDILDLIKIYENKGRNIRVNWFYKKDDFETREEVDDYRKDTGLKIYLLPY